MKLSFNFNDASCKQYFFFGAHRLTLLRVFKVVICQGDPFSNRIIKSATFRYADASFFFMGIILSECYKNINMHNIITPRRFIPQQLFHELMRENFTVYTNSYDICKTFVTWYIEKSRESQIRLPFKPSSSRCNYNAICRIMIGRK